MFPDLYPICVECLHIGIYKHSTQTGHKKVLPDMLIKVSAFYIDWVYRFLENSVETMIPQNVPNQCRMLTISILHWLGTLIFTKYSGYNDSSKCTQSM